MCDQREVKDQFDVIRTEMRAQEVKCIVDRTVRQVPCLPGFNAVDVHEVDNIFDGDDKFGSMAGRVSWAADRR